MKNMKRIVALALMALSLFAIALPSLAAAGCNHSTYGMSGSTLVKDKLLKSVMKTYDTYHIQATQWQYKCRVSGCTEIRKDATLIEDSSTKQSHDKKIVENFHHLNDMGKRDVWHTKREECSNQYCSWKTPSYDVVKKCYGCNAPGKKP